MQALTLFYCNISSLAKQNNECKRKILNAVTKPPNNLRSVKNSMATNKSMVPEAREGLNRFKMEAASEVGVSLKQGYNGDLTSKQAGSIGGQMVKKMVQQYENSLK